MVHIRSELCSYYFSLVSVAILEAVFLSDCRVGQQRVLNVLYSLDSSLLKSMWAKWSVQQTGGKNTVKWLLLLYKHQDIKYLGIFWVHKALSLISEILDCNIKYRIQFFFLLLSPFGSLLVTFCSCIFAFFALCIRTSSDPRSLSLSLILWFSFSLELSVP